MTTTKNAERQDKTIKVKSVLKTVGVIVGMIATYFASGEIHSPKRETEPVKQEQPAQPAQKPATKYYSFQLVIENVAPLTIIYDSQVMALEDYKMLSAATGEEDVQLRDLSQFLVRAKYIKNIIGLTRPTQYGRDTR